MKLQLADQLAQFPNGMKIAKTDFLNGNTSKDRPCASDKLDFLNLK